MLVRALGRWSMAALVLNGIIGSGVFLLPGTVGGSLGWASMIAWLVAAALIAAMVFCFAEVASRFTASGGAYLFTEAAFGPFVALQVGWLSYFVRAISAAVQANLFSTYLAEFVPWAGTRAGGLVVTTLFIGALAAVNIRGVVSGARTSNVFALVKIAPLVAFGILGLVWIASGRTVAPAATADSGVTAWLNALLLLMFAYGGFESAVIPLAEAKDPGRDAPFALLAGLALVTLLYLAAQLVVLATLPDPDATNRALADSARVMLGAGGAAVITLAALISVYGWLASNMLSVPRLSMAMAERGDFPSVLARIHPTLRTPWVSVLAFAGLSWVLANQAGLLQNLSLSAVSRLVVYGLVCASLPVFRRRDAHAAPAVGTARFRAPGGLVLAAIGVATAVTLATRMNTREAVTMAVVVALASLQWAMKRRSSPAA
ncbi:MAG TPA: APC family permease [Gemmatimonadaceae bacterium]|nr:APC family permease [Gemmatimonadaceae bacterium]